MDKEKILSQKEVIEIGINFDGDNVYYGGDFGQQVCRNSEEGIEEPITGVVYELSKNSKLSYYCFYKQGLSDGQYICFYETGNVKSVNYMYKGVKHGKSFQYFEDGRKRSESTYKYGFCESLIEWDNNGLVISEKAEPSEFDKEMIEKYENYEQQKREN